MIAWIGSIYFIWKTMRASLERRTYVLHKMVRINVFLGVYWYSNPEKEPDSQKKELLKYKLFQNARLMAALNAILAILIFALGLLDLKGNIIWFQVFSFLVSPSVGLYALFSWFMYYLMKDCDYFDKSLLVDGNE